VIPHLLETLPVLVAPFVACMAITALHSYMGLHVIKRGVIFVDLALAQCAALGAAVALFLVPIIWVEAHELPDHTANLTSTTEVQLAEQLLEEDSAASEAAATHVHVESEEVVHSIHHDDEHKWFTHGMSLLFALLGAVVLSISRLRDERVPHEAIIGIIFVVCAAISVLILSKAPHGHEKMEAMLVGSILFVQWKEVTIMIVLYALLGLFHFAFRKQFITISNDLAAAERSGVRVKLWDCLFYASFAFLVTHSVAVAGVFVVFCYLIIPPTCAALFASGFRPQVIISWSVAIVGTVIGLVLSAAGDMPTGASLVSCFGVMLLICAVVRTVLRRLGSLLT